jgi:two-component system chemotaxis response regulator CheB
VRVLIVDDSAFMRKALSQMIASEPGLEVIDTARNGKDAVEKALALKPDVITMDVEMPEMNGIDALREIRRVCPDPKPAVIMCSSLTSAGSHEALLALRLGAADIVAKEASIQPGNLDTLRNDLISKIKALGGVSSRRAHRVPEDPDQKATPAPRIGTAPKPTAALPPQIQRARTVSNDFTLPQRNFDLLLIGSSTGGPPVLEAILMRLAPEIRVPVVVAQHMPAIFTKSLAERLDQMCAVSVVHADREMELTPGTVCIIKGENHGHILKPTRLGGKPRVTISTDPASEPYRPSVDVLYETAAEVCGPRVAAVILTGMGEDGARGAAAVKKAGGVIIAQSEATCVVYGMPRAVADRGLADASMDPAAIPAALSTLWRAKAA